MLACFPCYKTHSRDRWIVSVQREDSHIQQFGDSTGEPLHLVFFHSLSLFGFSSIFCWISTSPFFLDFVTAYSHQSLFWSDKPGFIWSNTFDFGHFPWLALFFLWQTRWLVLNVLTQSHFFFSNVRCSLTSVPISVWLLLGFLFIDFHYVLPFQISFSTHFLLISSVLRLDCLISSFLVSFLSKCASFSSQNF